MEAWYSRILRSCDLHISDDLLTSTFVHPGLNYSMFDRDGKPSVPGLMFLCMTARSIAVRGKNPKCQTLLDWDWTSDDRLDFVVSSEFNFSQILYSKGFDLTQPLQCTFSVTDVGTSSITTMAAFKIIGHAHPVLTQVLRSVSVDATTRRPKAYPRSFLKMVKDSIGYYKSYVNKRSRSILRRPPNTFVHDVTVNWSDTDGYNHCNFISYSRFVMDAVHAGIKARRDGIKHQTNRSSLPSTPPSSPTSSPSSSLPSPSSSLSPPQKPQLLPPPPTPKTAKTSLLPPPPPPSNGSSHICGVNNSSCLNAVSIATITNGVKRLTIRYFKESLQGQSLNVHVWPNEEDKNMLMTSVERGDDVICQMFLECFDQRMTSRL